MNVAIIGCGLIGKKRAQVLRPDTLTAVCDSRRGAAEALQRDFGGLVYDDWEACLNHPGLNAVIVATPHHVLAPITRAAIERGLAVLVEKPAGLGADELEALDGLARARGATVRVGFNHRYHPAFRQIRALQKTADWGELMFIRGRYGQGGRIGMENEWRAQKELSGGGELIDQGVHLIDLARGFLGDVSEVDGWAHTYFWDMPVEDKRFYAAQK